MATATDGSSSAPSLSACDAVATYALTMPACQDPMGGRARSRVNYVRVLNKRVKHSHRGRLPPMKLTPGRPLRKRAFLERSIPRPVSAGYESAVDDTQVSMCYYPACLELVRTQCKQCMHTYCLSHSKTCGGCGKTLCLSCLRDVVYDNAINAISLRGPQAAWHTWANIISEVSLCHKCSVACTSCGVPAAVNGQIECAFCFRNVCIKCVMYVGTVRRNACGSCYSRTLREEYETAQALLALWSVPSLLP